MSKIDPKKYEAVFSVITKENIENSDFDEIMGFYNDVLENAIDYENKIMLIIDGYDNDPRELHQIPEVCDYFKTLDKLFPYWFYFLKRDVESLHNPLKMLVFLLIPVKIVNKNTNRQTLEYDMEDFTKFMEYHFHYFNELTDKLNLPDSENERIGKEIIKVLS